MPKNPFAIVQQMFDHAHENIHNGMEVMHAAEMASINAENSGPLSCEKGGVSPTTPEADYYDAMGRHGGPRGQGNPPEVSGGRRR